MAVPIYTQATIAIIWDFDRTIIPGYSQTPLFAAYGIDSKTFWDETNALVHHYQKRNLRVAKDTAYLNHILTYVEQGKFAGLTNSKLRELGSEIPVCPGMPEFMSSIQQHVAKNPRYESNGVTLEHYIISTGIRPLIEGSAIGTHVEGIWANEFIDQPPAPGYLADGHEFGEESEIRQVGYTIDNTSKTRAIFEINKGPGVDVNSRVDEGERRVPIRNMIYIADGPSDVPVFSIVQKFGGRSLGVYQTGEHENFAQVKQLEDESRVNSIAEANYLPDSQASLWIRTTVDEIATAICNRRDAWFEFVPRPPGHVTD